MFAGAFGSCKIYFLQFDFNEFDILDDINGQPGQGYICVFSLKNPAHPEYICEYDSGVMALDFHPQHPHMLVAGLYDGNVLVYNLQKDSGSSRLRPVYKSSADNGKHSDTVWQVKWVPDDLDHYLNFYSGRYMYKAKVRKLSTSLLLVSEDCRVTHWTLIRSTMDWVDKMVINFSKSLQNINLEKLKHTGFGGGIQRLEV